MMVMPYPSAILTMRFFVAPSIFSVMVARSLSVVRAGLPFMAGTLLKGFYPLGEPSGVHSCASTPYTLASYSDRFLLYASMNCSLSPLV